MKKVLFALAALTISACLTSGNLNAQEAQPQRSAEEAAALEAELFLDADKMAVSDDAKFAEQLADDEGDDDAKCWFWGYRYYRYSYPAYYYYTWYVPCYHVNFRLVTYTVPTIVTTPTTVTTTTDVATTTTTTATIWKSSGKISRGAVIDEKVPANSPLAKMGLRSGDVVTSVDGRPVTSLVDVRRIKANSKITYVRGGDVRVASKQLLQRGSAPNTNRKGDADMQEGAPNVDLEAMKAVQGKKMSMYDYYDMLEKEAANQTNEAEYGADQY